MYANGEIYRAGVPALGIRLLAAAGLVRKGQAVADIGCDHGKLSVWLALQGVCPKVIAVDNSPMPLEKAKALVRQTGCKDKVECRLGDGILALHENEVPQIIIAGLSGETMVHILEKCEWIKTVGTRLILVPTTRHEMLRRFLCTEGFVMETEVPVLDNKRPYTVMAADYKGEFLPQDEVFYYLGLVPNTKNDAAKIYIKRRLKDLQNRSNAIDNKDEKTAHEKLIKEVEKCLW